MTDRPFPRSRLEADPLEAARALLGAHLMRAAGRDTPARCGRIVEVEAYGGPEDAASHARFGPTGRNRVMFGPPGIAYVYLVYGMHHCLNVVVGPPGRAAAVLVRAVEATHGIDAMRYARRTLGRSLRPGVADARLASGPGLLGAAFGVDRLLTGTDLCDPAASLYLVPAARPAPATIVATPRVGVAYASEPWVSIPWRLLIADSPSVSGRSVRPGLRAAPTDRTAE